MQVNFVVLCNFASQLVNGSPVLAGVFRGIQVESFPARLEPFYLATEIEADPHEAGDHVFEIRMIDDDGMVLYRNQIAAHFAQRPNYLTSYMYFCDQIFVRTPLTRAGIYRFDLVWNDVPLAQARLEVSS